MAYNVYGINAIENKGNRSYTIPVRNAIPAGRKKKDFRKGGYIFLHVHNLYYLQALHSEHFRLLTFKRI